jgi:hypothetical protein|tara:strand:- start:1978 stop:2247 length:270 start_codon:yes stop_codon:yes gene_type:complete
LQPPPCFKTRYDGIVPIPKLKAELMMRHIKAIEVVHSSAKGVHKEALEWALAELGHPLQTGEKKDGETVPPAPPTDFNEEDPDTDPDSD